MSNGSKTAKYAKLGIVAVAATVVAAEADACEFDTGADRAAFVADLNARIAASDGGAVRVDDGDRILTLSLEQARGLAQGRLSTDNDDFSDSFCAGEYSIGSGSEV